MTSFRDFVKEFAQVLGIEADNLTLAQEQQAKRVFEAYVNDLIDKKLKDFERRFRMDLTRGSRSG